jgi:MFS transporter, MFS domain-containing protein family, molybdate-anion transporter
MCLVFCMIYTLSCLLILVPSLPFLFLGRIFGGISTSILYSAFESWLVSSANALALPSADLSSIFGKATLINGIVATTAGVVSNQLVATTTDFASPFVASGMLLVLAGLGIRLSWSENYGSASSSNENQGAMDLLQMKRLGEAWKIARKGA